MSFLDTANIKLHARRREPDLGILDLIVEKINSENKGKPFSSEFLTTLTGSQLSLKAGQKVMLEDAEQILSNLSDSNIEWSTKFGKGKLSVLKDFKIEEVEHPKKRFKAIVTISSQVLTIINSFSGSKNIPHSDEEEKFQEAEHF
ncbi:hypothetical protein [Galenea microaerophila]